MKIKLAVILKNLDYFTYLTEILPLFFCIIFYKKINTKALKVFFIYCTVHAIIALSCFLAAYTFKDFKLYSFLLRLNIIIEYIVLIYFFTKILENRIVVRILLFSIIPFLVYIIVDYIRAKNSLPNNPSVTEFLIFIVILIYFFFEKMKQNVLLPIYQTINFWICVGLFVYFTGSFFFLLLLSNVDKTDTALKNEMKIIYCIVTITKNLILGLSLITNEDKIDEFKELQIPNELELDSFSPNNNLN